MAFVGGIDLCHGRHDDARHRGDPQPVELDAALRATPAVARPAARDPRARRRRPRAHVPRALERPDPARPPQPARGSRCVASPAAPASRSARRRRRPIRRPPAPHAVQVLRTYPAKRPPFPFAPQGERSIARAYLKAFARARSASSTSRTSTSGRRTRRDALADALRRSPRLHVIIVVPALPRSRAGRVAGRPRRIGQRSALRRSARAGGDRVAVYDLENEAGHPIYVHAKVCVVDDVWLEVGSDNLNRRSWTHDSEVSCAVLDAEVDDRAPERPGGPGDGARRLARDTRLRLWREHLGRPDGHDADLVDPHSGFEAFRATAAALDAWHRSGRPGPRPPGHVRPHRPAPVPLRSRGWARTVHRLFVDPDGRPRDRRRDDTI